MSKAKSGNAAAAAESKAAAAPVQISLVTATVCRIYLNAIPETDIGTDIHHVLLRKSGINKHVKALRAHCADGAQLDSLEKVMNAGAKYFMVQPAGSDSIALSDDGELLGEKWLPMQHRAPNADLSNEELMKVLKKTAQTSSSSVPASQSAHVHTNKVYSSVEGLRDECPWRRFPGSLDGLAQDKIYVSAADALSLPKNSSQQFDRIPPAQILVTRALRFRRISDLGLNLRVSHCVEYSVTGTCERGAECFFIHACNVMGPNSWKQTSGSSITTSNTTFASAEDRKAAAAKDASSAKKKPQQQQQQQQQQAATNVAKVASTEDLRSNSSSSLIMGSPQGSQEGQAFLAKAKGKQQQQQSSSSQQQNAASSSSVVASSNNSAAPTPLPSPVSNSKRELSSKEAGAKEKSTSNKADRGGGGSPVTFLEVILLRICQREVHEGEVLVSQLAKDIPFLRGHPLFAEQAARFPTAQSVIDRLEDDGVVQVEREEDGAAGEECVFPTSEAVIKIKRIYKRLGVKMADASEPCNMAGFIDLLSSNSPAASAAAAASFAAAAPPLSVSPPSLPPPQQNKNLQQSLQSEQGHYDPLFGGSGESALLNSDPLMGGFGSGSASAPGSRVDSSLLAGFGSDNSTPFGQQPQQQSQHAPPPPKMHDNSNNNNNSDAEDRAMQIQMQLLSERNEFESQQKQHAQEKADLKRALDQRTAELQQRLVELQQIKQAHVQLKQQLQQMQQLMDSCGSLLQ